MYNRRFILGAGASALALSACGGGGDVIDEGLKQVSVKTGAISKVGIQTYTLREMFEPDPLGTLQMIKDVGYDYVELNGRNFATRPAQELKDMLDDVGLPSPVSHIGYNSVVDQMDDVIKTGQILGLKYVIVPFMAEDLRSMSDWKTHAQNFNQAGRKLADAGMKFAYHNHQFEFDDLGGGTTAMDILINETDPSLVDFELDLYWTVLGKKSFKSLFDQASGRFKLCHIKDMKGDPWTASANGASYEEITRDYMVDVGTGDIDFESIFAMNALSGLEYFVAEHDQPKKPFRSAIQTSYDNISAMRF